MRLAGRVFRAGKYWAIEVPILDAMTQGTSKEDAYRMVAEVIELMAEDPRLRVRVHPGKGEYFEVDATDQGRLFAFLLRRRRIMSGLSLADVTKRLGAKSRNSYARYEQGRSIPTVEKLSELLSALGNEHDFVLVESRAA
jgi:predicted RNase H-like HicB family nuclease